MTGLSLIVALQLSAVTAAPQPAVRPYLEAYNRSAQTGRPFVVLIEADWCTACQVMKRTVLPQVARAGGLRNIELAYVNVDRHRDLAAQLVRGKSIPQLVRFDRTPSGWRRSYLTGAKAPQEVYRFLTAAVPPRHGQATADLTAGTSRTPRMARSPRSPRMTQHTRRPGHSAAPPHRKVKAVAERSAAWSKLPPVPQPPQTSFAPATGPRR